MPVSCVLPRYGEFPGNVPAWGRPGKHSRRANWKLTVPGIVECPQCHQMKLAHRVCKHCGFYKGVQVVAVNEEKNA